MKRTHAHLRPVVAEMAAKARRAATLPLGVGAERALGALANAEMADEAWLQEMAAFACNHERTPKHPGPGVEILAVLLFHP